MPDIFKHFLDSHKSDAKVVEETKPTLSLNEINTDVIRLYEDEVEKRAMHNRIAWPEKNSHPDKTHHNIVLAKIEQYTQEIKVIQTNQEPPRLIDLPKWITLITLEIIEKYGLVDVDALERACEQKFEVVQKQNFRTGLETARGYIKDGHEGVSKYDPHSHLREDA